jgi:TDG/mug DNA glycosylase family protein
VKSRPLPVRSLAPIVGTRPHTIVLGSMPGAASLAAQQYYAHPRNAFWPIVCAILGADPRTPYAERTTLLSTHGIALWDVAAICTREASADATMRDVQPNAIAALLASTPTLRVVCLNGTKAATLFAKLVAPQLTAAAIRSPTIHALPSTSPAFAAMSFDAKLERWSRALTQASAPRHAPR